MAQLFLSYAREDRECAELFARELTARGWTVWWDRRIQVGRSFSEVIERELDDASCVVVLWSRHAVASPWVQTEATEAARRRVLVPVRIEDVRLPLEFRRLHTADLFEWRTRFDGEELDDCLASIELLAPKNTSATLPGQPAEPQQGTSAADAQKVLASVHQRTPHTSQVQPLAGSPQAANAAGAQQGPANVHQHTATTLPVQPSTEQQQAASTAGTQKPSADVHQSPADCWISQDGRQFHAPDLATLCLWVEEGRVRADSHVYDSSLQQWIHAHEVAALRSVWQKKTAASAVATPVASGAKSTLSTEAATPSAPRTPNRGRIIAFAIVGLLLVLTIISLASSPPENGTSDTAGTETSMTDTMATDTMATDTSATAMVATDTETTLELLATDTAATVDTAATTTTGPISVLLKNECTQSIAVAICYKNSAGTWISTGWFNVEPQGTKTSMVQAYGPNIYFYAEGGGLTWKGAEGDSMTSMIAVHDTLKFGAVVGELKGDGIKTVPFLGRTVDAGQSEYTQLFTCENR